MRLYTSLKDFMNALLERVRHFRDGCVWMGPDGHNPFLDGIYELSSRIWWQSAHQFGCYFEKATHHEGTTRTSSEIHWGRKKKNLLVGNVVVDACRHAAASRNLSSFSSSSSSPPRMSGSESRVCRLPSCEMCKESNSNLGWSHVGAREDGNCSLRKDDHLKPTCSHPTAHLTRTACLCVCHPWTLHPFLMMFILFIIVIIRR